MFVDEIVVTVYGGRGGHGMTSFRREKYVEYGGPSGGNGGSGGNIIFVGDEGKSTLLDFRYKRHIKALNGENGKSKGMHGANAKHTYINVPLGTIVYNDETKEKIGEITHNKQELVVAKGGRGGRGNIAFATNRNPAPSFSENGDKGQIIQIKIDLKVLADVGIIGFPSVGKSTLISVISNARPKIAEYHFTTLSPNLGMVHHKGIDFAVADLPGLIENASSGVGLGIKFLKHIERCRIFLHLIDVTSESPFNNYNIINSELNKYSHELSLREQIIVLNKIDSVSTVELESIQSMFNGKKVFLISAFNKNGLSELLDEIIVKLNEIPPIIVENDEHVTYELPVQDKEIFVEKVDDTFYVTGSLVELYYNRTNFSEEEGVNRFVRQLRTLNIDDVLKANDAKSGDTVNVYGFEFEYLE